MFWLGAALLLAARVSAADPATEVGNLQICAQTCVTVEFQSCHCPLGDFGCLCGCENLLPTLQGCASTRCAVDANQTMQSFVDTICPAESQEPEPEPKPEPRPMPGANSTVCQPPYGGLNGTNGTGTGGARPPNSSCTPFVIISGAATQHAARGWLRVVDWGLLLLGFSWYFMWL